MTPTTPAAAPRVGAVVLTWRDRVQTVECVTGLLSSPSITRVVVVDNEADGTIRAAFAPDPRIEFVELEANTGFAVGVNAGMTVLLADEAIQQLLVMNNDATLPPADIELLRDALNTDPALGVVGPRIVTPDGQRFSAGGIVNRLTWGIRQPRTGEQPDFLTWACVLIRRETLETAGLLDERFFMYWEDVEFGFRLRSVGIGFAEVADAELTHAVSSSHSRAGSRIMAYSSQAFRHFLALHGGATTVTGLARLSAKVLLTLARGDRRGAAYVRAGWRLGAAAPRPAYPAVNALP
ncbi:glycosyltransferase [Microbacterium sp. 22296]|uniref:glycosyltransferase n=1 Tax=Microbacterium sp. 22296 TaxID=3453903 RepID=UPI003F863A85